MLHSVRKNMPGVNVVQLTDEKSPAVHGVDEVRRKPASPLPLLRSAHYSECEGDWLLIDTDVVIQKDVRWIFNSEFDIALCDRDWPNVPTPDDIAKDMPFNAGVVFSRCPEFWRRVHAELLNVKDLNAWYGDQKVICDLAVSSEFDVLILPGQDFNCPPASAQDPIAEDASIVHYKGNRKDWMLSQLFKS